DEAQRAGVEVALEVAQVVEVRVLLVLHAQTHAERHVLGVMVEIDLPAQLAANPGIVPCARAPVVLDRIAGEVPPGAFGRAVAELVPDPEEAAQVGLEMDGVVEALAEGLEV